MSTVTIEDTLLESWDSLLEPADFLSPDSEFPMALFDQEPRLSASRKQEITFACPSGEYSGEGDVVPGFSESPEASKVEPRETKVVGNVEKKKRRSWGQELPIPTTNLPPRKRAKTDEEKEQRRVERILRNRAAARSSRERKEKQVASLEQERTELAESNASMRVRLEALEESNRLLREQLSAMEEALRSYEEHMTVVAHDVTTNAIARPAYPYTPTSFWGHPEACINEEENLLQFVDSIEEPSASTIETSVLGW